MIDLQKKDSVYVLTMDAGENRWNTTFVREFAKALDEVEKDDGPGALVTRAQDPKFFSNGLDLDWMKNPAGHPEGRRQRSFWRRVYVFNGKSNHTTNTNSLCNQWSCLWCRLYVCSFA